MSMELPSELPVPLQAVEKMNLSRSDVLFQVNGECHMSFSSTQFSRQVLRALLKWKTRQELPTQVM